MCEHLVDWANEQGGADNICVALAPVPRGGGSGSDESETKPETKPEEDV